MIALALVLGIAAALIQGGPLAALGDGGATVALPGAIAAGWAAVRGPREAVATVLAAATVLGALSETRAGLFGLALLPSAGLGTLAVAGAPGRRPRMLRAGFAGLTGAFTYLGILALAARGWPEGGLILWGLITSVAVAALTCFLLYPARPHDRRLFA